MLRYSRRMYALLHLESSVNLEELHVDENETVDQVSSSSSSIIITIIIICDCFCEYRALTVNEQESLLMDKRVARNITCVSSDEVFVGGTRFVCQWVASLARKVDDHSPSLPAVCCVSPTGLLVMLPVQRLLVPLLWKEVSGLAAKKELVSFTHSLATDTPQIWWLRVPSSAGGTVAFEAALKSELNRGKGAQLGQPWPNSYPPPRPPGALATDLTLPSPPTNAAEAATRRSTLEALYEMRGREQATCVAPEVASRKVYRSWAACVAHHRADAHEAQWRKGAPFGRCGAGAQVNGGCVCQSR